MSVDLNALALFVAVVECKSFSAAARRLGVPVSTVSRKVAELEHTLGVRLLERSTRKLRLTELGHAYYGHCRRGLEALEAGMSMINDRQTEVAGTLRLSVPPSLADVMVAPLVCAFQDAYPNVRVKVLVTERVVDLIEDEVDVALRVGALDDSRLVARPLLHYRHLLVASPEYAAEYGLPRHPDALQDHRLISFGGWGERVTWRLLCGDERCVVKVESVLSINDHAGIEYAAKAGRGIAELPSIICSEALREGRLVEVLPQWRFSATTLSAVYSGHRNLPRVVALFKAFCVDYFERVNVVGDDY